jgi:large subunit ribosomal protein L4
MARLDVLNIKREKVAEVEVADVIFDAEMKQHLFHEVIRMQMVARRAGTSSTKTRAEVRGGGKKPWKQKGTGRARSGSSRSPVWRGGGAVFGPRPRDYGIKVPKKVRRAAMCTALTQKRKEDQLLILDAIQFSEIKTRQVVSLLNDLQLSSVLIIDDDNGHLSLSARNVPNVKVLPPEGLNLYDVLLYRNLCITQPCLEKIQRRLLA